ncbi:hypothetical protein B0I35DRAFT_413836 [Stachybotrys elegans]|uniref:DUF6604 domain-containing protein n=1 Tax=Stachybotrys elegans TaxID=80388 RepID=A0A8K0SJD0_9HYPO|nr:hypothetical protein B0I35DRAFT_413836 [Stachybotrys elegans]
MLPPALKSIYQQYKADTDVVATWLAVTAKEHGYTESTPGSNSVAKSARLKGKARKKAQKGEATPNATAGSTTAKPKHVLKIKEFEPIATFLAAIDTLKVPDYFAVAIERVIWVRKSFSGDLQQSGENVDPASDQRHAHFVGILEKARDLLKPLMETNVFNMDELKKAISKPKKSKSGLDNMFGPLGVYEPSESFLNAPDVELPQSPPIEYTLEREESLPEAILAFTSMLLDFDMLRSHNQTLWGKYKSGEMDLAAVSVATNLSFELARDLEEDIAPLLEKHGGVIEFTDVYFNRVCEAMGIDTDDKPPGSHYNVEAYEIAQGCLFNTMSFLAAFGQANRDADNMPVSYNGKFGWYKHLFRRTATNEDRFLRDKAAVLEICGELHFLQSNLARGAVEDELVRGMAETLQSGLPKIWFGYAMQVYLDILEILDADCQRGYKDMRREVLRLKKAMLSVPLASKPRSKVLRAVSSWDKDPMYLYREQLDSLGLLPNTGPPPFQFLHQNPMYCGLWLHHMRQVFHMSGVEYAAAPGALMATTQLYHALRQEGKLEQDLVWEDLATFWKQQGDATFFVGSPPTDREGYFKNYCLSIGSSISNWATSKKRSGKININVANRRNMKFMGKLGLELDRRLLPTGSRMPMDGEAFQAILERGRRSKFLDGKGHIRPECVEAAKAAEHNPPKLSGPELISQVATDIQAEIPETTFNYFAMHDTVWALLQELRQEALKPDAMGSQLHSVVPNEDHLPHVVGCVFSAAAGRLDKTPHLSPDFLMDMAANTIRAILVAGKGRCILEQGQAVVSPKEVAGLKYAEPVDAWGYNQMMKKMQKMAGSMDTGCPTQ